VIRTAAVAAVAAVTLAACNHPRPRDPSIELRANAAAAARADHAGLRLVTYNVHMIAGAKIAAALRADPAVAAADVVVLQEVDSHPKEGASRACLAARELGMHCAFAPGYGLDDGGSHGVAILARWPLADLAVVEQPYNDVVFNSARRIALGATIEIGGAPLRVFAVHLDNRINPAERARQLAPVLDAADRHPGPVAIAGDMNTTPFVWIANVIPVPAGVQDDRLERYVRRRGYATPVVRSGPTHQYMGMRLDAVYTRGVRAGDYGVASEVRASDHLPLWVDLAVARDQDRVAGWTNGRAASSWDATRIKSSSRP
jgi:endonuclease/exonuclease/phosphatase family metal-dependent hydrolase